jgi:sulfatase modifying factor 1
MTRTIPLLVLSQWALFWPLKASADTFGSGDNTFEIEFVTIGNPGNASDTTGDPSSAGSVDYVYRIGKFEINRDTVEKANAQGGLGITLPDMTRLGGNGPNRPATGVSWNEAARFTNWLNASRGFPVAYKFSTQPGEAGYDANSNIELWVASEPGFDAGNPFRNSRAKYYLPSVDEWYKAAYYDPAANGGTGGYWNFPTGSDTPPTAVANGTNPNTAVYLQPQGAEITQAGGLSPFGVMGLGGNVWEWVETEYDLTNDNGPALRDVRGGAWLSGSSSLSASVRAIDGFPSGEGNALGFRVANIPEPSSLLLGLLGTVGLLWRRAAR